MTGEHHDLSWSDVRRAMGLQVLTLLIGSVIAWAVVFVLELVR